MYMKFHTSETSFIKHMNTMIFNKNIQFTDTYKKWI